MQNWIYFVLIAELIWAFTSLFDKILISKGYIKNPFVFIVFNGVMNILLIFLLPFFSFESLSIMNFFIVLIAGIFLSFGIVFYYKAVQYEEISRVLMLWQLIPVFVLLFSFLFLKEILTKNHFIGFIFLFTAGIIISYKKVNNLFRLGRALYFMLVSTFLISIYYIISKYVYSITSFWSAFMWLRIASFAGLGVLLVPSIRNQFAETFRNMQIKTKGLITSKMVIDFSAFIFLGYAMLDGPISLISALGSATAPVFIFLITLFTSIYLPNIVKEEINTKTLLTKLLAIVFIIIGTIFINL